MRKSLAVSFLLHVLIILLVFFSPQEKKKGGTPPFYARIVSPDELKDEGGPPKQQKAQRESRPVIVPGRAPSVQARPQQKRSSSPQLVEKLPQKIDRQGIKPPDKTTHDIAAERKPATVEVPSGGMQPGQQARRTPGERGAGEVQEKRGTGTESKSILPQKPLRDKLFDPDVIGAVAQKEKTKSDNSITFDTKEYKYYGYMQRLREKIESAWTYPAEAAQRGIYGDLKIRFTIKKNGQLGAIDVLRTSGYKMLDEAALRALKSAEPYWPLPNEWDQDGLTITGHFVYSIYGARIR